MKCVKAQGLITKYINNELHGELLEDFLEHMDECRDCKEDLEIYYVIMKGMQQIDEDNVLDYNFHRAFEHDLMDSKARLVKSNKRFIVKLVFTILPVLPLWWLIKLLVFNVGYFLKAIGYIVSWPFRCLLSCCVSNKFLPDYDCLPEYWFNWK